MNPNKKRAALTDSNTDPAGLKPLMAALRDLLDPPESSRSESVYDTLPGGYSSFAPAHERKLEQQLNTAREALREIMKGCEYRLRKGNDEGDASTLRIAKAALKELA